ncbi:MAG: hypothetical protein WCP60_03135 [bacterium]
MNKAFPSQALLHTLMRVFVVGCFLISTSQGVAGTGIDSFQPLTVTLQPKVIQTTRPAWEISDAIVQNDTDSVLIPVPSLASQDVIGCFALTVVFQDHGDGGPVVEWIPKDGESVLLSAGLGEAGVALGLNARTLLISQSLALDGGMLRVGYVGRFERMISVTLRPARELSIAALGPDFIPGLAAEDEPLLSAEEISGTDLPAREGDRQEGKVIHAELSSQPRRIDAPNSAGSIEFILPLASKPQGSMLQAEIGGLDPESSIEVSVNGTFLGALRSLPFSLSSPSTIFSNSGRLLLAGWRPASIFIPAQLWKEGDNSVLMTLHRVAGDEGQPVHLKKARVDLLFTPLTISSAPLPASTNPSTSAQPVMSGPASQETLSTGSAYGNPPPSLFRATPPLTVN